MIKNLIFDFGKVLVDYDFPAFIATIFDDEAQRKAFFDVFCSQAFCDRCDVGLTPYRDIFLEYCGKYPQWEREILEFYNRQMDAMKCEMPGMRDILTRLKARGYRLYGLTNWNSSVYGVMEKYGIFKMLDDRIISSEEHLIKPNPAIYGRLCEKFSVRAEECLFTDDKQANIDGALSAGMEAVLFVNASGYERSLAERGIVL